MLACEVVWAELASGFPAGEDAAAVLDELGIAFSPIGRAEALAAGAAFRAYRSAGGRRDRVVPDFLIGAHAKAHADRLLTRDRGFFRDQFRDLLVLRPDPA